MARLIEEIILKVGIDEASLNASLANISRGITGLQKDIDKLGNSSTSLDKDLDNLGDQAKTTSKQFNSLENETSDLDSGFDKLTKSLKRYNKESKEANKSSKGLSSGIKKVGALVGTAAVVSIITDRVTSLTEAAQDADRLGVVTQNLINLQNIGRSFGATAEDVTQGIKNINESASEALADGSGEKFDLFKELNIDLEEFNKLKPDEQLESFSKSINGVEDQGRRTAIQLALMGEEGFKLANTMDELAVNAEGAKKKVEEFTGSLNTEEITKLNKSLSESKLRWEGIVNTITSKVINDFNLLGQSIDNVSFQMFGLLKLAEDWNDTIDRQQAAGKKLFEQRKEQEEAEEKRLQKEIQDQKELSQLIKEAQEELNDPRRQAAIEESPEILRKVEAERKRINSIEKAEQRAQQSREKEAKRELQRQEKAKNKAIKDIEDIGLKRKKEFLKRLQEESKRGGAAGLVEAGGVEAAEIEASLANRDIGKLSKIETVQKQINAEEKQREEKKLKVAEQTLAAIEKQKPVKVNTSSL